MEVQYAQILLREAKHVIVSCYQARQCMSFLEALSLLVAGRHKKMADLMNFLIEAFWVKVLVAHHSLYKIPLK